MSDDLIQRLRDVPWAGNNRALINEAADRITLLEIRHKASLPAMAEKDAEIARLRKALVQLIADYEAHTPYTASAARRSDDIAAGVPPLYAGSEDSD